MWYSILYVVAYVHSQLVIPLKKHKAGRGGEYFGVNWDSGSCVSTSSVISLPALFRQLPNGVSFLLGKTAEKRARQWMVRWSVDSLIEHHCLCRPWRETLQKGGGGSFVSVQDENDMHFFATFFFFCLFLSLWSLTVSFSAVSDCIAGRYFECTQEAWHAIAGRGKKSTIELAPRLLHGIFQLVCGNFLVR